MGIGRALIERYVWRVVLPYFLLTWLLLTVVLLLQQGGRYTDIVFGAQVPGNLILELALALLPNILAFTSPMALLAGIMIGLGQLQGDSELVAIRAAGVSAFKILLPCLVLGGLLTVFTLFINIKGVPASARLVRNVAARAALAKLESPLEPGIFNTEIPNYLIYAQGGNVKRGVWERVFMHTREKNGNLRLITAASGKIDAEKEHSELVLEDAVVTTLAGQQATVERVAALRVALETGRRQLLQRLQSIERKPDEMGLSELAAFSREKTGNERLDAQVLWHRRVSLAFAPLIFALLAVGLSLRFSRGGRGWNSVLALFVLIVYYLLALFSEQSVRGGIIPAAVGGWLPTAVSVLLGMWWLRRSETRRRGLSFLNFSAAITSFAAKFEKPNLTRRFSGRLNSFGFFGLLERDLLRELFRYFILAVGSLLFLFLIFTAFDVWKFVATTNGGFQILLRYLLFLSPTVIFQVAPTALLLTVLATFAMKSKRGETTAWNAAGQNVYRLLFPGLLFATLIGWGSWELQERVLPQTDKRQDMLRAQLRGGGIVASKEGRIWFSAPGHIYSFVVNPEALSSSAAELKDLQIYKFGANGVHLQSMLLNSKGEWRNGEIYLPEFVETIWRPAFIENKHQTEDRVEILPEGFSPFGQSYAKMSQLTSEDIRERLQSAQAVSEQRRLSVSLQRRYSIAFLPFVVALFSAPFALTFGRRGSGGASLPLVYAFAVWLMFLGALTLFEQLGNAGALPAALAAWSPIIILASFGSYFLAKTQS